jgi:iron complex transport system substrate-binding protein
MRVVSLLPSATETVYALGAGELLKGRSAECDYPSRARDLPVVMRARELDNDRPSREIDARVRSMRSSGESLYDLDLELLAALRPEIILTQDLCRVCSVTNEEVVTACAAARISPSIVTLGPTDLDGVIRSVEEIGAAIGHSAEADRLAVSLRARTRGTPPVSGGPSPSVAVVEWLDPPILSGLWTPDMVAAAGGTPVRLVSGDRASRVGWNELAGTSPDLVVLSPCSFTIDRTKRELRTHGLSERFGQLHPRFGTWVADEAYFSRPGPRLADGVELLRSLLRGESPNGPMPVERWTS